MSLSLPPDGPFSETHLRLVQEVSHYNRRALAGAGSAGCYACETIFPPDAIRHWVDVPTNVPDHLPAEHRLPQTAICPHCDVDAVVPATDWLPVTSAVLRAAHTRWFTHGPPVPLMRTSTERPPGVVRIPRAPTVVIPPEDAALLEGVPRLGDWLCSLPETTAAQREAIRTVLAEWAKLPALSPGFSGSFECSVLDQRLDPPLSRSWRVEIDEPDDVVMVFAFAVDNVTYDIWHAMPHECYHSWNRGAAETDHDRDPAKWLAQIAELPAIRAAGQEFEVDASASWDIDREVTA